MNKISIEDYYRVFIENSLDAILLTSPDGRIHWANRAACEMFCMTEKEICDAGRKGLVDTDDPRLKEALERRSKEGRVRTELTFIRKDGTRFPGDLTSSFVYTTSGEVLTIIIVRDVSIWKETERLLKKEKELLEEFATVDYLTNTLNRREFIRKFKVERDRIKRAQQGNLALIMIDMDHLKEVNDKFGHLAGDLVLQRMAGIIASSLRPYDVLGRYGGDEFVVCLSGLSLEDVMDVAERIRININSEEISYRSGKITMSASLGLVLFDYKSEESADSLILKADDYMYMAKRKRNSVYHIKCQ